MLIAWGGFTFEMGAMAFDRLTRNAEARWKDHDIIGRRPAGQFLGPGKRTLTLVGVVFAAEDGQGAAAQVAALEAASDAGQVNSLVTGTGKVYGPFRLETVAPEETFHDESGAPARVGYTLTFGEQDDGNGRIFKAWP